MAIENCLISDLSGILTSTMVIRMSEERLQELASESDEVRSEREVLQHEIELLRKGLSKCQISRPHKRTGRSKVAFPAQRRPTVHW